MSKIYVASLTDYNAMTLHGKWIDLDGLDAVSLGYEVQMMLNASPTAEEEGTIAEEYAIHDYEGFGGFSIGEYTSLEFAMRLHELVEAHGAPFAVFAEFEWSSPLDTADDLDAVESAFNDAWIGNVSAEDYAHDYVTDCLEISGTALEYFDFERFARDMVLGGDVTEYCESGEYYLFSAV